MNLMDLIFAGDEKAIEDWLIAEPTRANVPVALPDNHAKAHPLHRICDAVFNQSIEESFAVKIARIFFAYGADLNSQPDGTDSPLTAACSLRCDELALLYIDHGANVHHRGCHGGTALHWAAWCGRVKVVDRLLRQIKDVNSLCVDFKATPLFWAAHGFISGGDANRHQQINCARVLIEKGADPSIPNREGVKPIELLSGNDREFYNLLDS